uniref:Zinc metalloproteinase n=1 Tax=Haemonchus contortus TaxID=6289 RepID=A0A7I4YIT1_HAECO
MNSRDGVQNILIGLNVVYGLTLRGADPEQRRERLRNLQLVDFVTSPPGTSKNSDENAVIEKNTASIPEGGSIIEKNRLAGISDYLYEGDINLTEEQLAALESKLRNGTTRPKRQASKLFPLWTNKTVFYYYNESFVPPMRTLVNKTLAYLSARTCLTFVEDATATNRVRVIEGDGCYSSVGMIGGEQDLSLGCGTAADQPNYNKLTTDESVNYTPYEYGSVMHYDAKAYATKGGVSMIPVHPRYLRTMGSHMVSFYDISMINYHYKCNAICATKGANCVNGGIRNPKNCNICICPAGYGGALCSLRPAGCGAVLTAAATWKERKVVLGEATNTDIRDPYSLCNDWIQAPAGKKVQLQVTKMNGVFCLNGCWTQGIEFKTLPNKLNTNPRICCPEQWKQVITSSINPTPVINYNNLRQSIITYLYRYI